MKIVVGEYYRHKDHPSYAWAKVIQILEPHRGINTSNCRVAKCEWTVDKDASFGFIKYFKLSNLAHNGGK